MSPEKSSGGLTEYIVHHLTHNTCRCWATTSIVDSWLVSLGVGLLGCFLLWSQARKATSGVPCKGQAFVEIVVEFVDGQVKDVFHGDRTLHRAARADDLHVGVLHERHGPAAARPRRLARCTTLARRRGRAPHLPARRARPPTSTPRSRCRSPCSC